MSIENIEANWKAYEKFCRRLSDDNLNRLLDDLGERIVMCPATPRTDQYNCEPGGLVKHSLDTTIMMRTLNKSLDFDLPIASVLKVGLLHDLGKVGDLENDYFVEQDSDWHREKLGQHYKYNEDLQKMSTSHRTLYLLQHYGVKLTTDEWLAIQLAQGSHFEENRFYVGDEPSLALLLQLAKRATIHKTRATV
tara:strand:- start:38 stop:616 length:579 start_codon:yes stop_codon:yes gene_type:complete